MTTYHPKHLRAMSRIEPEHLAKQLSISVQELRALEDEPIGAWRVQMLMQYAAACGYVIRLVAGSRDARVLVLQ